MQPEHFVKLRYPDGIRSWQVRCQFTNKQAAVALGLPMRTWFHWCARGLPLGSQGYVAALAMSAIEDGLKKKAKKRA